MTLFAVIDRIKSVVKTHISVRFKQSDYHWQLLTFILAL